MLRIENDHLFKQQLLLCFSRITSRHKSLSRCTRRYTLPAHRAAELLPVFVSSIETDGKTPAVWSHSLNFLVILADFPSLAAPLLCLYLLLFTPVYFFLLVPFPSGRENDPTLNKSVTFK